MQQFQNSRTESMTDREVQDVLAILAERQRLREEHLSRPTVDDIAELAHVRPEDVRDALTQVRSRPLAAIVNPKQLSLTQCFWISSVAAMVIGAYVIALAIAAAPNDSLMVNQTPPPTPGLMLPPNRPPSVSRILVRHAPRSPESIQPPPTLGQMK